ncbi:interaptin-like isoform X1 [Daphnia pulicaria]|uniref:interaptin-like isoform X1 n=1 Tax=Daphnia pulicaria TaxID=35523 RepID=UPI001EECE775|nr:interaptin-like isoform X1 [Daphnia pulicaria]XP_046631646.1 interaptin-like isoform X1 [Daphnia pulicaria]XP_046631647.1 interaptin-like isoform X1 [Daphnia pulicaria]
MPRDSRELLPTTFDRRLHFLEKEILKKDQQIESLQILCENGQRELSQTKIELSVAKSYINTLPTQQKVVKLKNIISDLNEEKEQLTHDFLTLKELNSDYNFKILALHKEVQDKENALQSKADEVDALKYTIKLWENRRKAAQEAGHVTVEDVVAEKMKLQQQFQDMLKIAACREQYFKARIDKMKDQVDKHKLAFDSQKEKCTSLHSAVILKLENESEKNRLEIKRLTEAKERLEEAVSSLNCKLAEHNACEIIRKKTDECVKICIAGISKCQKCVKRLIDFINKAISKQFLDPSLLFSTGDDCFEFESEDGESLNKLAEKRMSEINALDKLVGNCQKTITDIYVSNLSNSVESQCQVQ